MLEPAVSTVGAPAIEGKPRGVSMLIVVGAVLDAAPPYGVLLALQNVPRAGQHRYSVEARDRAKKEEEKIDKEKDQKLTHLIPIRRNPLRKHIRPSTDQSSLQSGLCDRRKRHSIEHSNKTPRNLHGSPKLYFEFNVDLIRCSEKASERGVLLMDGIRETIVARLRGRPLWMRGLVLR